MAPDLPGAVGAARASRLHESRVAMVSSAALVLPDHEPFDFESDRGGDPTFRTVPADTRCDDLVDTHPSKHFDHGDLEADRNVAFPLDRLRELAERGRIGEVAPQAPRRSAARSPRRAACARRPRPRRRGCSRDDGVDVALLFPGLTHVPSDRGSDRSRAGALRDLDRVRAAYPSHRQSACSRRARSSSRSGWGTRSAGPTSPNSSTRSSSRCFACSRSRRPRHRCSPSGRPHEPYGGHPGRIARRKVEDRDHTHLGQAGTCSSCGER